jgi:hypothetical protein
VASGLGLGDEYGPWLDLLESAGAPEGGVPLPRGVEAATLLESLGVYEPDRSAVLWALPLPDREPELWWLLQRSYQRARSEIGHGDAVTGRWPSLPPDLGAQGRCFWAFVFLAVCGDVRRWHHDRGVPDGVSWATLSDLGRHVAAYRERMGTTGLDAQLWVGLSFRGALYTLGRLQFLPYRLLRGPGGPLFWYEAERAAELGPGFRAGDEALSVHIPDGEPLTPDAADDSFSAARTFFPTHFPQHRYRVATCTSWVLDDQLAAYLPPSSNIVRFQRRFEIVPGAREDDSEVLRRVFGRVPDSLDALTPRTTLERAVVQHLRAGGHWRMRTGWLEP